MVPYSVIPSYALAATNNATGISQPFSGPTVAFPGDMVSIANATQEQVLYTPTPHYDVTMPTPVFTSGTVQSQQVQQTQYVQHVQQAQTQVQSQVQSQAQPQSQLLCGDYLSALLGLHDQQLNGQLHTSATTPTGGDADEFTNLDLGQDGTGGTWPNIPAASQDYEIQAPTLPSQNQGFDMNTLPSSVLPFNEQDDMSQFIDTALLNITANMNTTGSVVTNNNINTTDGAIGADFSGISTTTSELDLAFAGQQQQQPISISQNITQQQQHFPYNIVPVPSLNTSAGAIDYGMVQQQQLEQQQQQQVIASTTSAPLSITSLSTAIEQYNLQHHQHHQQQQQHGMIQQFNRTQQLQQQQQQVQAHFQAQTQLYYGIGQTNVATAAAVGSPPLSSLPPVVVASRQYNYHPFAAWTVNPHAGMVIPTT
ncbi:hypothetical protein BGZ95_004109, partial [Linnemannia exigua]